MMENVLVLPIVPPVPIVLDVDIAQVVEPAEYVKVIFQQQLYPLNVVPQRNLALKVNLTLMINPIIKGIPPKSRGLPLKI
ncbi:hypothetical protein EG347_13790 [Chryseobacterium sp. G0186]|nr:hypothetical protein EG347_13790 [Chryseobacterium sp. G0186]